MGPTPVFYDDKACRRGAARDALATEGEILAAAAIVHGVDGFSGTQVKSPDLRGGAALVMAGLVADGITTVSDIHHIDRGYEGFVEKLGSLGARIRRTTLPDEEYEL